ncbi:hypothetical protein [Flavobacterium oreochromis]|uniref:Oxidase n=2 Tax=Flavobacterium TaxID=237 RepID=A0A2D0AHN4_9FLAO|nr:hypothetical protein [Flavobacterium oreochromis]OWP75680.1 hypothetical protein BWK62_11470 [Flavobacterium oreochromis]OWP78319.1 hypothetical protein BWG23_02265 [Flavobacterium oreochromis]POR25278.1 hypothetical protein BWK58_07140 [Flavobacterium columnare]QYS85560.1 hypothetical protein JJC03_10090 [Flavobacterium oreochromis]
MNDFIINDDLKIAENDFLIDQVEQQNIEFLLLTQKGNYKEFPILGVGISQYVNSPDTTSRLRLENEIDKQLSYDNFYIKTLDINNLNNIIIDGHY